MKNRPVEEEDDRFPLVHLTGITFSVATQDDIEKMSVLSITSVSEVTDSRLGLPNPSSRCSTCGATNTKHCEGHPGCINLLYTTLHPYYLPEVAKILNRICPACKSIRRELRVKAPYYTVDRRHTDCTHCHRNYPRMKFKVSTYEEFKKSSIIAEVCESTAQRRSRELPEDYWNFLPRDPQLPESCPRAKRRVLSHAQVHNLIKDLDPKFFKKFVPKMESTFVNSFPVTANRHRVEEFIHGISNERRLTFDKRTTAYRKLVGFRGSPNELGSLVLDTFKMSKLYSEQSSKTDLILPQEKKTDCPSKISGSRWMKDVNLGKRSDNNLRMVTVGDPNVKLTEIGVPCNIAEKMLVPEVLNRHNLEKLDQLWNLRLFEEGAISVRRKYGIVLVRPTDRLHIGDTIYRPLREGDIMLINRPPSTQQHSIIALTVKVLSTSSVLSLNPLCCSPFRGDFDGDCLHGYVPQSIDTRSELKDLVALDKQLFNGQSGKSLISLSHDSLTAAYLILEDTAVVKSYQKEQLQMFCENPSELSPAIIKAPLIHTPAWTGRQVFSMILPRGFNYEFLANGVRVKHGELVSVSEGSSWLNNQTDGNLFHSLAKYSQEKVLDILYSAQQVLCEWSSMTGLSVSLQDLYLTADSHSHKNLMDEVFFALQEAEEACIYQQLLNSCEKFIAESSESPSSISVQVELLCYERQISVALSQASVDACKGVLRDVQGLAFKYAEKENSLIAMFKAGSKGNMLKLVQQSMCLGVQSSLRPLSFRMPRELSCAGWNDHKSASSRESSNSYIPFGIVGNSFLTGLNPLEAFLHSVTTRESSFSDNAQLPGTLTRRLMFFMRDIYIAYDGTVRNAYGNQLVQLSYDESDSAPQEAVAGHPVGVLAGCALSEAAYSALDQPISLLETSPLLNLKSALECGSKKGTGGQTMSLYVSGRLGRLRHGFEYGALEVKNHLEGLTLSDITSSVMIIFTPQTCGKKHLSPWVCHFHVFKEILRKRRLNVQSVIDSLYQRCNAARAKSKVKLPNMQITSKNCSVSDAHEEDGGKFCISVTITERSTDSTIELNTVQKMVIPYLLGTFVKGFQEIKRVDVLWNNQPQVSKSTPDSRGELYLRVNMSGKRGSKSVTFWSMLMNYCLPIMDLIDWSRSYPENVNEFCVAYGIDAGWKHFLNKMESAVSDVGKTILPQHLLLVANSLSATGEFVGLTAKGLAQQKEHASVASPFTQACFSTPAAVFIKAAKNEVKDGLHGSLDALAWGNIPPFGTGAPFEFIYSGKGHEISQPTNVHEVLMQGISPEEPNSVEKPEAENHTAVNFGAQLLYKYERSSLKGNKKLGITKVMMKKLFKAKDIWNLAFALSNILQEYPINRKLNDLDFSTLMLALFFHPRRDSKIGTGAKYIKVANHPKHQTSRCFMLVRTDGTSEDFSYRKCILSAFEIVDPKEAEKYRSKMSQHGPDQVRVDLL